MKRRDWGARPIDVLALTQKPMTRPVQNCRCLFPSFDASATVSDSKIWQHTLRTVCLSDQNQVIIWLRSQTTICHRLPTVLMHHNPTNPPNECVSKFCSAISNGTASFDSQVDEPNDTALFNVVHILQRKHMRLWWRKDAMLMDWTQTLWNSQWPFRSFNNNQINGNS